MRNKRLGRPPKFDREVVLNQAMEIFWRNGAAATTTRTLEDELGVGQSSLYNTFGSKEGLLTEALAHYEAKLDEAVLSILQEPSKDALCEFVDALHEWVGSPGRPGCLIMNLAAEDPMHHNRLDDYRDKVRTAIRPSIETFSHTAEVGHRTELLVVALFGLTVSARTAAEPDVLDDMASAIKAQISAW